ncbi:MAG: hypothetical protein ACLS35_18260, partial [Odoribacter splanchnicus]
MGWSINTNRRFQLNNADNTAVITDTQVVLSMALLKKCHPDLIWSAFLKCVPSANTTILDENRLNIHFAKLLQKSEMRKDIVIEL